VDYFSYTADRVHWVFMLPYPDDLPDMLSRATQQCRNGSPQPWREPRPRLDSNCSVSLLAYSCDTPEDGTMAVGFCSEAYTTQMRGLARGSDGLAEIEPLDLANVVLPRISLPTDRRLLSNLAEECRVDSDILNCPRCGPDAKVVFLE
jgi:hypothetical protein